MLTNLNLTDMETCYKVFRREVIQSHRARGGPLRLRARGDGQGSPSGGCRIYEVGISYAGRTYAEGKKIGWRDGVRALYCIARYSNLGPRAWRTFRPGVNPQTPRLAVPSAPARVDRPDLDLRAGSPGLDDSVAWVVDARTGR